MTLDNLRSNGPDDSRSFFPEIFQSLAHKVAQSLAHKPQKGPKMGKKVCFLKSQKSKNGCFFTKNFRDFQNLTLNRLHFFGKNGEIFKNEKMKKSCNKSRGFLLEFLTHFSKFWKK